MDIVLISPYSDISALGIRGISSVLKRAGHAVRLVFLPYQFPEIEHRLDFMSRYSESVLARVTGLCRGAGLIGVSLMTNYFEQAATLTTHLREKTGIPVIWGGIHPTIRPEECLDYADCVCVGEGEQAMLDVVTRLETGRDLDDTPNIHLRRNGRVIANPPRPMIADLDSLPFFDYDMNDHHVLDMETDRIIPLNPGLLRKYLTKAAPTKARASLFYQTIASRGCPHHCTYCCWDAYRKVYRTSHAIRRRSIGHIMSELGEILERMPWFAEITFSDDSFLDAPVAEIEEFAREYKRIAHRPFQCLAEPRTITRERIEPMVDAGMVNIQIGIQTGSKRIQELYQRTHSNERVLEMARLLNEYIPRIRPPIYDFILDNPWETPEDKYRTLQLLTRMPPPFFLQIFRLTFFPGTGLFEKARSEGLISDDIRDIYGQQYNEREIHYVNLLFSLFSRPVPRFLMRLACSRPAIAAFHRPLFNKPLKSIYRLYRKWTVKHAVRPIPVHPG
ncbi:B12-binding domain-containing radical SAM protein [bacterium]|nr:B12-binding domain-containing radical SAM protein [candidate division CSSED10-310 bacterium]